MNKKRYVTLTLVLSIIGMNKSYAACTQEQLDAFKLVEKEYKITYELNHQTKLYNVIFHRDINKNYTYVIDSNMDSNNSISSDTNVIYNDVLPGKYSIGIIHIESDCQEELKSFDIKVPRYNIYSEDPLCEDIKEFYLCKESYDKEIDRETFVSRVNTYKRKLNKKENTQEESKKEETNNNILDVDEILKYIKENLIQVFIITIFTILLIITTIVTIKQSRKSRRLE